MGVHSSVAYVLHLVSPNFPLLNESAADRLYSGAKIDLPPVNSNPTPRSRPQGVSGPVPPGTFPNTVARAHR